MDRWTPRRMSMRRSSLRGGSGVDSSLPGGSPSRYRDQVFQLNPERWSNQEQGIQARNLLLFLDIAQRLPCQARSPSQRIEREPAPFAYFLQKTRKLGANRSVLLMNCHTAIKYKNFNRHVNARILTGGDNDG